jgi:hypothetical protein
MVASETQEVRLDRWGAGAGLVGVVLVIVCLIGMFTGDHENAASVAQSYLFALIFWSMLTIGFFGLTTFHHTIRAKWSLSVLRIFESGGGVPSLLLIGALFVPVLVTIWQGSGALYEWSNPSVMAADHILQHKAKYLNPGFFTFRLILFFAVWALMAAYFRRSALRQDETLDEELAKRRTNWAAPGLVAFVLTCTFAFTDWVMSLEPHWFSTIYGIWFVAGMTLMGLSTSTLFLCLNATKEPYRRIISPSLTKDLGNMMLAFTMFWAYVAVSQYLIIWSGNLPEFAQYFHRRSLHGWNIIGFVTVIGHFFIPFMMLLSPRTKAVPANLARVCVWIILMRLVDTYLVVVPAFHHRGESGPMPHLFDFVALAGIGCLWFAVFASQIKKAPLIPAHDTRLMERSHHA